MFNIGTSIQYLFDRSSFIINDKDIIASYADYNIPYIVFW